MDATVEIDGVTFHCFFDYEVAQRATYNEPGNPEIIGLYSVRVAGNEMIDLLSDEAIGWIEKKIKDKPHETY